MSYDPLGIENAVVAAYGTNIEDVRSLPTRYPNQPGFEIPNDGVHATVDVPIYDRSEVTIGVARNTGALEWVGFAPIETGSAVLLGHAAAVAAYFDTLVIVGPPRIRFERATPPTPPATDSRGYYRLALSVPFIHDER